MLIADILRSKPHGTVHTIDPQRTILDAVQQLVAERIGCLVVTTPTDGVVGIITERDILEFNATRHDAIATTRVVDEMACDVIVGKATDHIHDVMRLMTERRIRHLPILNDDALVGLISIGDLVKRKLEQAETEIQDLHNYITGR